MSEDRKDDEKKNENDPYSFFKLDIDNGDDRNKDPNKPKKPQKGMPFWGILLVLFGILAVMNIFFSPKPDNLIDFSEFRSLVEQGQIVRVELGENYFTGYSATATSVPANQKGFGFLKAAKQSPSQGIYRTSGVLMQSFIQLLDEKGVDYKFVARQNNFLVQLLLNLLVPFLFIFLLYFFLFRKMGSGMSGSMFGIGGGKSKAIDEGKGEFCIEGAVLLIP